MPDLEAVPMAQRVRGEERRVQASPRRRRRGVAVLGRFGAGAADATAAAAADDAADAAAGASAAAADNAADADGADDAAEEIVNSLHSQQPSSAVNSLQRK